MKRRGFTLVELAIVLVIIGLLIGGILVAQSMMSSAKLQKMVKALQQYDIAAQNFETKYNGQLPGDAISFAPAGDGDGAVFSEYQMFSANRGPQEKETFDFWLHLHNGGMLAQNFTGYDNFTSFSGDFSSYQPLLPYGTKCYLAALSINAATGGGTQNILGNVWIISGSDTSNPAYADCMTSNDAWTLDAKLDDGIKDSGDVQINYEYSGPRITGASGNCQSNTAGAPGGYDVAGKWINAFNNQPETTPHPERIGCTLAIKANW